MLSHLKSDRAKMKSNNTYLPFLFAHLVCLVGFGNVCSQNWIEEGVLQPYQELLL